MTQSLSFSLQSNLTLPPGRFPMTFDDIETIWTFNDHRQELLDEARTFIDAVDRLAPIHVVWIGGSYLTDKEEPSDVDMSLLISEREYLAKQAFLSHESLKDFAAKLQTRVDPFTIARVYRRGPERSVHELNHLVSRGYWDDWWLRRRSIPPESYDLDPNPRRGYAEVNINGYS